MRKILWFGFQHGGTHWKVFISDSDVFEKIRPGFGHAYGVTDAYRAEIHISDQLAKGRRLPVLSHELVHLLLADANPEVMKAIFHANWQNEKSLNGAEERIASWIGSGLAGIYLAANIVRLPYVKVPRVPKKKTDDEDDE